MLLDQYECKDKIIMEHKRNIQQPEKYEFQKSEQKIKNT